MPAQSKSQLRYIFALRDKYKTKKNTPEDKQWIWDKEWEDVDWDKLPDKADESIFESFNTYLLNEYLTDYDLKQIEKTADSYFNKLGLDIEFTKHFKERVNDRRNKEQITADELNDIFKDVYKKYGFKLRDLKDDYEAVFKDLTTDINSPFVINYDGKDDNINIIMKTIMRKPGFKTQNTVYKLKT